jgi:hypothetical protein
MYSLLVLGSNLDQNIYVFFSYFIFLLYVLFLYCFPCGRLPWEPPTGYQSVVTNNRNNTGIVTMLFYIGFASRDQQKYMRNMLQSARCLGPVNMYIPAVQFACSRVRVACPGRRNVTRDRSRSAKT